MKLNTGLPLDCTNNHKKIKFENFELLTSRPNNCCITKFKDILVINHIGKQNGEIVVIAKKVIEKVGVDNYPTDSMQFGICQIKKLSDIQVFKATDIERKAVMFDYKRNTYIVPLLHS